MWPSTEPGTLNVMGEIAGVHFELALAQ